MTTYSSAISDLVNQASHGDSGAIAQLLNRALMSQQIITKVSRSQAQLTIFADSATLPSQESLVGVIRRGINDLHVEGIQKIKIYGRQIGGTSASWIEEIVLSDAPPLSRQRRQSTGANQLNEQLQTISKSVVSQLGTLSKSKLFRRGAVSFGLLVVLGIVGTLGYGFYTYRAGQAKTINAAQVLVSDSQSLDSMDLIALQTTHDDLQRSMEDLKVIPDEFGSMYSQAQAMIEQVQGRIETIEMTLVAEEEATQQWESAKELGREAAASVGRPPYSVSDWSQAQQNMDAAIQQLQAISVDAAVYPQVESDVAIFQQQKEVIEQGLAAEATANQALVAAHGLAQQAYNSTVGRTTFQIVHLQRAQQLWQQAITQLSAVPQESYAYRMASSRMTAYSNNLNTIRQGIERIQSCRASSTASILGSEYCGRVYLNLRNPEYF
jgi:hypothetical protein